MKRKGKRSKQNEREVYRCICPTCGKEFYRPHAQTFCSHECMSPYLSWLFMHPKHNTKGWRDPHGEYTAEREIVVGFKMKRPKRVPWESVPKPAPKTVLPINYLNRETVSVIPAALPAFMQPKPAVGGYVYLIQADELTKIGMASDYVKRYSAIRTSCPQATRLLFVIETADMSELESHLHRRFHDKRVRGEWFRLTDEDIANVRNEYIDCLACVRGRIVGSWKSPRKS